MTEDFDDYPAPLSKPKSRKPQNPLQQYFRLPGIHVTLPSGGQFMKDGTLETTEAGDVEVYPMRAADEMILKSPDALISGNAIERILTSCVPGLKDAGEVSTVDLDVLLLAIRAASFGNKMDVDAPCPACNEVNTYECDLPMLLTKVKPLSEETTIRLSPEVVVQVRPYTVRSVNALTRLTFTEARRIQAIEDSEARTTAASDGIQKVAVLENALLADCVVKITIPDGVVTQKDYIAQFLENIPSVWHTKIRDAVAKLNQGGLDRSLQLRCTACDHEWETQIEFDPSTFFGPSS